MISNAKGRHVSPGVYTEEKDVILSVKSLGITSLGLVGETLYGPAFENIEISEWNDFVDYFGGTSSELYKDSNLPKYELPYIAKSYLTKSKRLNVVKVLGFSGYNAGKCWVVTATDVPGYNNSGETKTYPLIVIRGKKKVGKPGDGGICNPSDSIDELVNRIEISEYNGNVYNSLCGEFSASTETLNTRCKLCIHVILEGENSPDEYYNVSLDPRDGDYIYKVISSSPQDNKTSSIYIEAVYEYLLNETDNFCSVYSGDTFQNISGFCKNLPINEYSGYTIKTEEVYTKQINFSSEFNDGSNNVLLIDSTDYDDYQSRYRYAFTPWIVSEATVFNTGENDCNTNISINRLFRFITISDGDASNYQVKISIEKIDPFNGTFDVVVRDFNDTDSNIIVLEKFAKCSMKKGETSFIGYKIGTSDGLYGNNSKYITVELASDDDMGGSVPCGFLGYPTPRYSDDFEAPYIKYNTIYNPKIKERKQYFGISNVDSDILSFKGRYFYVEDSIDNALANNGKVLSSSTLTYTKGFHLDSIFNATSCSTIYIDGDETSYEFEGVSVEKVSDSNYIPRITNSKISGTNNSYIDNTIYRNEKLRKFTVCFYGGFDGWDINRDLRTNTDAYNVNNYGTTEIYGKFKDASDFKLPSYVNTSDYYAYLAGYKVLSNPQDVDINIFATPGIDWYNNTMLTKDAIEVIEDPEDGRGGDSLYIMNSPYGIKDVNELADAFDDTEINSSYACTYAPWILYKDTVRNQYLYLPVTKDVVRNIADTDNTSFPWFAPAGTSRGIVECDKAQYKTTLDEEDTLYGNRINPIKTFGKDGVIVWGNKTAYDVESPLNRINVRRLMIRVKKLITSASKHLIFEQYDDALEKQFRGLIEPILADVKSNRGIFDYRVITEVTPETRDQHILPAKIMIKPTPALEYISITFVVYPESVAFEGE